ncbi:LysM peptidoglycan-binding domain-containing protein [Streptomyces tauricus]|uniref:LysM peptidoglycan-binding domain-containing protein n=1 Tax=Streptomyces tauricus TaxID=68274 RepID=UPI0022449C84|nr:LysM peptidoglycan-binding domain-containing protein [Streptomyces tauricus]MCW8101685.1 LysM peptidoglycan-binding domain-containing protein [Streptomyces tauricus]
MPHSPTPVRRQDRFWLRAVVRGLFALVALAALALGVPALLLAVGTLPATVPTLDEAREVLLSSDDDGSGLLATMTVAAWIAWMWLVVPVLIEIVAVLARRTTPRLPGMATGQRLAGFLLGSIVLASPAAAASAATPAIAATAPHAPSTEQATSSPALTATEEKAAATAGVVREFTVGAEDTTWWELAEQLLGNGTRYTELQRLNPEVPTTATVVAQGTTLRVPGHAEVHSEATDTAIGTQRGSSTHDAPDGDVVTVEAGDSLSEIAAEELHDGSKWPQLFEASAGTAQPDGLPKITDPDVIYPGQQVTVPGAASERPEHPPREDTQDGSGTEHSPPSDPDATERAPGTGAGSGGSAAPSGSASSGTKTPAPSESSRPAEQPSQGRGAAPTGSSTGNNASSIPESRAPSAADTPTTAASQTPSADTPASSPAGQVLQLRMVLGAGALLAAAVTGALATRRMLQRRRRKPGATISIASETSSAEAQLAAAAEPGGSARLDVALRTMAHRLEDEAGLPGLRAARIGARALEVLPEDLALEPPAPFMTGRDGWWVLPAEAELLDDEAARDVPAPYPGLVTLGSTEGGDLLLVNLAQVPALLLDGDPARITEVCTSLAVEIGMSPWGSVVEVVAVGFGEDLPRLLPTSRIMHMQEVVHALRDLAERLLEVHQMPEASHHPYLLLCAATLDEDTAWQFADVIDKARIPVTLVAPAATAAVHFPDAEILNAELDAPQRLDYADAEITVQRLERAAYQQIVTALAVSGQPAAPAEGPWEDVPDEPEPEMMSPPAGAEFDVHAAGADTYAARQAPVAPVTVRTGAGDHESDVFPALLAASADPAGLRLLPTAPLRGKDDPNEDQALVEDPSDDEVPKEPAAPLPEPANSGGAEESEAHDVHAPEIRVLGPVEVDGVVASGHGPRIVQLAALLFFRPGRSADALCTDMDPLAPWSSSTLNARLRGLRSALGNDPAGNAYVPRRRTGDDPYRLSPAVRCDWTTFLQLAERALPQGPAGLQDLEKALGMVRGRPFGSRPLPWAGPFQQEMITRIIDVAHTVASHRTPSGPHQDLTAARQAVATGLDVDTSAEILYRDWMRVEYAAGNRSGLHTAITQVQQVNRSLDCDLEMETEQLINDLLHGTGSALRKAQ